MKIKLILSYFALAMFVFCITSLYIVDQRQFAIETQFGEIKKVVKEPGLKIHIPFIREVVYFDNRVQHVDFHSGDANELLTADQKTLKLDAFAKYRIVDVTAFHRAISSDVAFRSRLNSILESTIREIIGTVTFSDVLRSKRGGMMDSIAQHVNSQVSKFGVDVLDVRFTTVGLPEQSRRAVYNRMRTDRNKEAAEIRANGAKESEIIRAQTEKEKEIMLANANKEANILKGEGDAEAARVMINVAKNDVSFFKFYRSLNAYKDSMKGDNTSLIINTDEHPFFSMTEPPK